MLGLMAGVAVGLLIAPEKGEDLRHNIADTADKWKNKFNRMVGRAGARLDDLRAMLEQDIEGLGKDVRQRIMTLLEEEGYEDFATTSKNGQMGF